MRVAYVDDTKQRGRLQGMGQLVALGVAIFDEDRMQPSAQAFLAIYNELRAPHEVELKSSNSQRHNWWAESDENKAKQSPMRERVLQLAHDHGAKVVVVVWDESGKVATAPKTASSSACSRAFRGNSRAHMTEESSSSIRPAETIATRQTGLPVEQR